VTLVTASFDEVAETIRAMSARLLVPRDDFAVLVLLGFAEEHTGERIQLSPKGLAFDDAWTVYRDRDAATQLLTDAYLQLPATQALMQGLHGRASVPVEGAQHLLVRHGLAAAGDGREFRRFLQVLNDLEIIAYSKKQQSIRVVAPMPLSDEAEKTPPKIRVIEKDRPFSNVRHFREILRECKGHIWKFYESAKGTSGGWTRTSRGVGWSFLSTKQTRARSPRSKSFPVDGLTGETSRRSSSSRPR
jgi:hypothetical protein